MSTMQLKDPVDLPNGGGKLTQMTFRPIKAKDYMGVDMRSFGLRQWAADDCMRIIANNTGTPLDVVMELSSDDFNSAISHILDFFDPPSSAPLAGDTTTQSGDPSSSSSGEASPQA